MEDAAYCIMPSQLVFFTASFSSGELTIATPRTPPCHSVHFDPLKITIFEDFVSVDVCKDSCTQALGFQGSYRRGQLFPASRYFPEFVAPPLSVVNTTIELANIPCSAKNFTWVHCGRQMESTISQ